MAALLAMALVVAACSSNDDSDAASPTSTTSTTSSPTSPTSTVEERTASFRGVTADTIKIGFVDVDFERLRTELGIDVGSPDTGRILEALIADLNDRGGINGRLVEVVIELFLPANVAMADEICLRLIEDEAVFAVLGGFGGPGAEEGNGCITGPGETILVGGQITDERLAQATAPWISPDMDVSRRGSAFVTALVASGELDDLGPVSIHAVLPDQDETADTIRDALVDAGADVALRTTGLAGSDQVASVTETELMLEQARIEGVESIIVVGTSPTVTDTIFGAGDFTVIVPNTEEVANLDHATFGEGDRLIGGGSIATLDDPELAACVDLATAAVGADAIPDDASDGDLSFWTSTLRACRNVTLFEAVATEAGTDLTNESFRAALATVDLPPLPVYEFASLGADKADARDTLSVLEWDADLDDFVELAGPFDVAE
ncbi:MAG: hypothetical protein DHS20C19_06550 [Acidimicrobiales bacterium]|nr:MAG: hypothetical protein DHS20C19_06550 [Acidimicrobiales bacterium]